MLRYDRRLYRPDPDVDDISPERDTLVRLVESKHQLWPWAGGTDFDALEQGYATGEQTPVAIKTARWRVKNGTDGDRQVYAHGRFVFDAEEHDALLDAGGKYAFLVYEKHPKGVIPLFGRMLPATIVDDFLDTETRIAWPDIIPNTGAEL